MFFNRRATIRCVNDSLTPNRLGRSTTDRALKFTMQPRSIGCEISRNANLTNQWVAREKVMSPDENTFGFIASEEDESSSEIILQTETTGLGPIQIFSYSELVRDSWTGFVRLTKLRLSKWPVFESREYNI